MEEGSETVRQAVGDDHPARERLLAAAAELFADRGYAAISVREICETAGVTKPTLYYYFGSKEGLAVALLGDAAGNLLEALEAAAARPEAARDRLKTAARIIFERSGAAPKTCRFFYASLFAPTRMGVDRHLDSVIPRIVSLTAAVFEEGCRSGELRGRDPQMAATVLLGAVQAFIMRFVRRADVELTPALADRIVDALLDGFAVPSGKGESP